MVEIGNSLEMRAMSVGLQEKMIKTGSDCARFSPPPPARRLRLLDHCESTGRIQREQNRVSGGEVNGVCEGQKSRVRRREGKDRHNAHAQLFLRHN